MQEKLLDPSNQGDKLPRQVGIADLTDADLLMKIFLPEFSEGMSQQQEGILLWIVRNWTRLRANAELCKLLSETKFVATGITILVKPNTCHIQLSLVLLIIHQIKGY